MSTLVLSPPRPRTRTRRFLARTLALIGWAVFGFAVVCATVLVGPTLVNRKSFTILSGSMTPTLRIGDVVVDRRMHADQVRPGDIVTFRDPNDPKRLLTHRIVRYRLLNGIAYVVTKGDANHTVERWSIPANGTVGRVEYRLPKIGYLVMHVDDPRGRFLLVAIPAALLGLYELKRLWFPKGRRRA